MAIEGPQTGDIRATLAISQAEARTGSSRTLNLPGGRRITVPVRAGIRDGEEIRLRGQGEPSWNGGPPGDLILTVSIATAEQFGSQSYYAPEQAGATEFMSAPPYPSASNPNFPNAPVGPAVVSSSNYPPPASRSDYSNYAVPGQGQPPLVLNQAGAPYVDPAPNTNYTQTGAQVQPSYIPPPQRKRSGTSAGITLLIVVLVLLLVGGSIAIFYTQVYQPQMHAQATATSQARINVFPTNSSGGSCGFTAGAYHSTMTTKSFFQPCYSQASNFSNFALQVQMIITQGDEGGVIFRANNSSSAFYLFRISQSGAYDLYVYVDSQGSHARRLLSGSSTIINTGNQANTITVIADNSNLYFYVNQQYLDGKTDTNYSSGQIGLFGESDTNSTDVAFSNLKVWTLAS